MKVASMTVKDKQQHRTDIINHQRSLIKYTGESVLSVLDTIHELISTGWTQRKAMVKVAGITCFCLQAAIDVASLNRNQHKVMTNIVLMEAYLRYPFIFNPMRHDYHRLTLITWNDDKRRTKTEVLSLLTRLIDKVRRILDDA